jgi:hypothetical protein
MNQNRFALGTSASETVDRFGESAHRKPVVKMSEPWAKKSLRRFWINVAANQKKIRHRFGDCQSGGETGYCLRIGNPRNYPPRAYARCQVCIW